MRFLLIIILFLTINANAQTGPFYVATNGNDNDDGSFLTPFATIQKAANVMSTNVTVASCYIFPGTYNGQTAIYSNKNPGYMVFTALSNNNPPVLDGSLSSNFAFRLTNVSKIKIQCLIIKSYTNGIEIGWGANNNIISKNQIYSNENNGVILRSGCSSNYILTNHIWGGNQDIGININWHKYSVIQSNQIYYNNIRGIELGAGAISNYFINNLIYSNGVGIRSTSGSAWNNFILTNNIFGHSCGLCFNNIKNCDIIYNKIHHNINNGIHLLGDASGHYIANNYIFSNYIRGIYIQSEDCDNNYILTNKIWGENQDKGILIIGSDNINIYRNIIYNNEDIGIYVSAGASNINIINNTIFGSSTGDGVCWSNVACGTMFNNIILSNGNDANDFGIDNVGTGSVYVAFNNIYGNFAGITNGTFLWGNGNKTGDPLINTVSSFEITSKYSPAVDNGTNYYSESITGNGLDMGWKESPFTGVYGGPYFVDDTGNDADDGTFNDPFLTVQKAAYMMMHGVTVSSCFIFPGTYNGKTIISSNKNPGYMVFTALSNNKPPVLDGSLLTNYAFKITNASKIKIHRLIIKSYTNGIIIGWNANNNIISKNQIYSNENIGIYHRYICSSNYILTNHIWGENQETGISLYLHKYGVIQSNQIYKNNNSGIDLPSGATSNYIINNQIYSNVDGIRSVSGSAGKNFILTNNIYGNVEGIYYQSIDNNEIKYNKIHHNVFNGIHILTGASGHNIANNNIYSNSIRGISIESESADNNYISTNRIWGENQNIGISIYNCDDIKIYRNIIYNNETTGIYVSTGATNIKIINNTIFGSSTGDGVCWSNAACGTMFNNIILSNGNDANDFGIENYSIGSVYAAFNIIYGNFAGITNGAFAWGNGNLTLNPLINTSSSFEITSSQSPAVDSGTNYYSEPVTGNGLDMGWKESPFTGSSSSDTTAPDIKLSKDPGKYIGDLDIRFTVYKNTSQQEIDSTALISVSILRNNIAYQNHSGTAFLDITLPQGAKYDISYYAVDEAENTSETKQAQFIILKSSLKDIGVYPTIVDLNEIDTITIVNKEQKNNVDITICTLRDDIVKKISGVDFRSGYYEYNTKNLEFLPAGTYLLKIRDKKFVFVIIK